VVATPVVAVDRVVVATAVVAGAVVTVEGRDVVELNGGNVTVEVASSPPPHPVVSASATASDTVKVIARLACMHAD
jgi:hypothetical protein